MKAKKEKDLVLCDAEAFEGQASSFEDALSVPQDRPDGDYSDDGGDNASDKELRLEAQPPRLSISTASSKADKSDSDSDGGDLGGETHLPGSSSTGASVRTGVRGAASARVLKTDPVLRPILGDVGGLIERGTATRAPASAACAPSVKGIVSTAKKTPAGQTRSDASAARKVGGKMTPTARTAVPHGVRECVESHTSASVDPNVLAIVPRVDARHWAKKTAAARERAGREEWIEAQRRAQELARQHAADLTAQQQWDFAEALHQRLMMPMATINYDMLPHLVNPIMATAYPSYPAVGYRPSVPQVASISEMHPLRHNHQATPGQVAGPPAPMPTYAALHWNNRYVSSLERERDYQVSSYSYHSLTLFPSSG